MKLRRFFTALIMSCLFAQAAFANEPHTWHKITASNSSWAGRLVITSANQKAFFTDQDGNNKGSLYDFNALAKQPFIYGFGVTDADFNVSYALTLYQTDTAHDQFINPSFSNKACQFNVSAKGPADPDIRVEEYNGAKCQYTVIPGVGEYFYIG